MSKRVAIEAAAAKLSELARTSKAELDKTGGRVAEATRKAKVSAADVGLNVKSRMKSAIEKADANHEALAEQIDTAAQVSRVAAGVTAAGALVVAPTGLTAVGVALGVASAPVLVSALPVVAGVAATAATASAAASLYKKARKKRTKQEKASNA